MIAFIRQQRKKYHIRTDELSIQINKGASYISQIESGKIKTIKVDTLDNICNFLHCDREELIKYKPTEKVLEQKYVKYLKMEKHELLREIIALNQKLDSIKQIISN